MAQYMMSYCLSVSILLSLNDSLYYGYPIPYICFITLGCFLVHCISQYRKKLFLVTVLGLFSVSVIAVFILSYRFQWDIVQRGAIIFQELYKSVMVSDYYLSQEYVIFPVIFLSLLVTFIVHIFTIKVYKPQVIIGVVLLYFLWVEIAGLAYSTIGFFFFCFISVLYYLESYILRYIRWKDKSHVRKILSWASVTVIGILLITSSVLLSQNKTNPLDWIDDVLSDIQDVFMAKSENSSYVDQDTTVSDLHDKPYHDETLMMTVETDDIIYLRGMVYHTLNGSTWHDGKQPILEEKNVQENRQGLRLLFGEEIEMNHYLRPSSAIIRPKNIATDRLFTHLNTVKLEEVDHADEGYTYKIQYEQPQYDNPEFIALLRKSKKGLYKQLNEKDTMEYVQRANEIYRQYTALPSNLTDRVLELTEGITHGYEADIDKVRAIETYLSQSYTYTLEPDLPYGDMGIVDYFLFESKEGFCTHYASAMVVMVKALGLPARYVTGYKLPYTVPVDDLAYYSDAYYEELMDETTSLDYGVQTYYVRDTDAHAWVEVYFEGFGWLTFEPTGAYYDVFHQYANGYQSNEIDTTNDSDLETDTYHIHPSTKKVMFYVMLIIGIIVLWLPIIKHVHLRRKYRQSNHKEQFIMLYDRITVLLDLLYQPRQPSDSISLYLQDAEDYLENKSIGLIKGACILEKIMYTEEEIQKDDIDFLESMYGHLKDIAKIRFNNLTYTWYKYTNRIM
ncbi:transglutaminase domain-containing protein [Vallitalea pronyensis]|uniref:Transglutaminase domain-containing protein n=1 Tax=Vallitalea pronyensis TaxID=1348613 RepID=A0A8J8SHX9_9FIRM|nr:transglutaminase-like domain-containing protein [Vallitalea pronyensis]QUI23894.1 transglutaminase domain-containing protein [Vallitalea pronyensis]